MRLLYVRVNATRKPARFKVELEAVLTLWRGDKRQVHIPLTRRQAQQLVEDLTWALRRGV